MEPTILQLAENRFNSFEIEMKHKSITDFLNEQGFTLVEEDDRVLYKLETKLGITIEIKVYSESYRILIDSCIDETDQDNLNVPRYYAAWSEGEHKEFIYEICKEWIRRTMI